MPLIKFAYGWGIWRERKMRAIKGVWGKPPQRVPGPEPLENANRCDLKKLTVEMSGDDFFNPNSSRSQWLIHVPIPDPRLSQVLFQFHSHQLFLFTPAACLTLYCHHICCCFSAIP